jgi:hypothetical protein
MSNKSYRTTESLRVEDVYICGDRRALRNETISELDFADVENESDEQAKLWEIAENLHRAELSVLERSEHIAEWVRLTDLISLQSATKIPEGRGRPESGLSKASRELGLEKTDIHRATKIAGLTPEAKKVAVEVGLDGNQSALLEAKDKSGDATKAGVQTWQRSRMPGEHKRGTVGMRP